MSTPPTATDLNSDPTSLKTQEHELALDIEASQDQALVGLESEVIAKGAAADTSAEQAEGPAPGGGGDEKKEGEESLEEVEPKLAEAGGGGSGDVTVDHGTDDGPAHHEELDLAGNIKEDVKAEDGESSAQAEAKEGEDHTETLTVEHSIPAHLTHLNPDHPPVTGRSEDSDMGMATGTDTDVEAEHEHDLEHDQHHTDGEGGGGGTPHLASIPLTSQASQSSTTSSSFVRNVHTPQPGEKGSVSSPLSGGASGPKKFSAVNINKKFLAKTGKEKEGPSVPVGALGAKPNSLGLGSLSGRPSPSSTPVQAHSSLTFKTGKLTTSLGAKVPTPVAVGTPSTTVWAKPAPATSADKDAVSLALAGGKQPLGLNAMGKAQPPMGSGMGMGASLGALKKAGWLGERKGFGAGDGSGGNSSRDYPTAKEVSDGQRSQLLQQQMAIQARAAHNQAILDGLDAFRGTNRDPNMHYWDEDDDEISFDQVVDFGDGTTYTLEPPKPQTVEAALPAPSDPPSVTFPKEERFASDDFDRSWPPKAPHAAPERSASPPRRRQPLEQPPISAAHPPATSRTLFNDRAPRPDAHHQPPPALRPQLMPRDGPPRDAGRMGGARPPAGSGAGFERALPPHLADLPARVQEGDLGLGRHAPRQLGSADHQHQGGRLPSSEWKERAPPPHLSGKPPVESAGLQPLAQRRPSASGGDRRGWQRDPLPHPAGGYPPMDRQHQPQQHHLPAEPVMVPAPAPIPPPPAPVAEAQVDIDEMQKDEMHSAAERARLRRQQEEEERAAKAERAKQKAKELAERLGQPAPQAREAAPAPPSSADSAVAMTGRRPSSGQPTSPVLLKSPLGRHAVPAPAIAHPKTLLQRPAAPSGGPLPPPGLAMAGQQWSRQQPPADREGRPLPPHLQVPAATGEPSGQLRPNSLSRFQERSPSASFAKASPVANGIVQPSAPDASPAAAVDASAHPEAGRAPARVSPHVFQNNNWRKPSGRVDESVSSKEVPAVLERPDGPPAPPGLARPPGLPVPREVASTNVVHDDGHIENQENMTLSQQSTLAPAPKGSPQVASAASLDDVMARIRSAMAKPSEPSAVAEHAEAPQDPTQVSLPSPVATKRELAPQAALKAIEPPKPVPVPTVVLPRPEDFGLTRPALPSSPKTAWKRFTTKVPAPATYFPTPPTRTVVRPAPSIPRAAQKPPGWILTWEPPLDQMPQSMSRDELLIGKPFVKGKLVANVKLPSRRLVPVVKVVKPPVEVVKLTAETSAAPSASGNKKKAIVVKLPAAKRTPSSPAAAAIGHEEAPTVPGLEDFAQTAMEVQTSSPIASPSTSPAPTPAPLPSSAPIQRQRSPRKLYNGGHAVTFAQQKLNPETLESKGSVRFMVNSELEGDNLLEEVNNMSLEGLGEAQVEETEMLPNVPAALKTPTSPSSRSATAAKSGPPSPNAATSAAWNSGSYNSLASPARGLPSREHIKNVWSQATGEQMQQGNSLMGIVDDFPNMLPNSVQDLKEEAEKLRASDAATAAAAAAEAVLPEDDSPRYASISNHQQEHARSASAAGFSDHQPGAPGSAMSSSYLAGSPHQMPQRPYSVLTANNLGAGSVASSASSPHVTHAPTSLEQHHSGLPVGAIANSSAFHGYSGGQQGVWMPISANGVPQNGMQNGMQQQYGMPNQAESYGYNGGIKAQGLPNSPRRNNNRGQNPFPQGMDFNSSQMQTVQMQNAAMQMAYGAQNPAYMGAGSAGIYSQSTGPLDSPSISYGIPRPYDGNTYVAAPGGQFGAVNNPRQQYGNHHAGSIGHGGATIGRPRPQMNQGIQQTSYGPSLLSGDKLNGGMESYNNSYKGVGGGGAYNQIPGMGNNNGGMRQQGGAHARGGSSGAFRGNKAPWG